MIIKSNKRNNTVKKSKKLSTRECIIIICMTAIIVFGVVAEFSSFSLITIDSVLFYSCLTTIVSVQASIIAIGFSFLSIITAFVKEERYGISVVNYALRNKYCFLSLRKSLILELSSIIISFTLVTLEYMNILFAVFIDSVLIIGFLSYNLLDILSSSFDDDMFLFLKQQIACGYYEYFNNYCEWVKKCIKDDISYRYEPAGRIKEFWLDQIKRCANNFSDSEFSGIHNKLMDLLKLLFKSTNDSFSSYSLDTVGVVLSAYIEECGGKLKNQKNFSSYAKELYSDSLSFIVKFAYSSNSYDYSNLRSILEMYYKAETICFMYSRSSGINQFINCYVIYALNDTRCLSFMERKAEDFYLDLKEEYTSDFVDDYTNYYIHLFLTMMQYGLFTSVANVLFQKNYFRSPNDNLNMEKLYGVVFCFLYYIAFYEDDEYLENKYNSTTVKDEVISLLMKQNEMLKRFFQNIDLSEEYLETIQNYLKGYEIYPVNQTKIIKMRNSVSEGIIMFKLFSIAPYFNDFDWIYKLVKNDWYSYYARFVNNKTSENKFLKIAEVLDDSSKINVDNKLNKSYEEGYSKLSENVASASFLYETENNKWSFSKEDEKQFRDKIIKELDEDLLKVQSASCTSVNKETIQISIIVKKSDLNGGASNISTLLKNNLYYHLGVSLSKKLNKFDVNNSIDVKTYFDKTKDYDWHFGERYIPYYGDFNIREEIVKRVENIITSPSFSEKKREHCIIDAYFSSLKIRFDKLNLTFKELSDEDVITEFNYNEEDGKVQIVNDVSFHMSKEQFLTYIKNQHRAICFSCDAYIDAEKRAGLLTVFHRRPIE